MKQTGKALVTSLATLTLLSADALAQAIGATGGAGVFGGLINWATSNVIPSLGLLGIIVVGGAMMYLRHSALAFMAFVVAGIWIMANAASIYAAVASGGAG